MKASFMISSSIDQKAKRGSFVGDGRSRSMPKSIYRPYLLRLVGGLLLSTILFWVMVQLGQASSEPKPKAPTMPATTSTQQVGGADLHGEHNLVGEQGDAKLLAPPVSQGPAIDTPREVLEMLDQRKRDLDRREEAIRQNEERLMIVRSQIEELLEQNEAVEKKIQSAQAKKEDRVAVQQSKAQVEKERLVQEERARLAKMYESMPSEDAAARLERMPDRRALEILRLVKSKVAGAILSQVKAERAAKLTEQLLAQMP